MYTNSLTPQHKADLNRVITEMANTGSLTTLPTIDDATISPYAKRLCTNNFQKYINFNKVDLLKKLKTIEPNVLTFSKEIKTLIIISLCRQCNWQILVAHHNRDRLFDKYEIDQISYDGSIPVTLCRIETVFPGLTCTLLNTMPEIKRLGQNQLPEGFPRAMMSRSFCSILPTEPIMGKLKIIKSAILYAMLEDLGGNILKINVNNSNEVTGDPKLMVKCIQSLAEEYHSVFIGQQERKKNFATLNLYDLFGYPILPILKASALLNSSLGSYLTMDNDIKEQFKLSSIDLQ